MTSIKQALRRIKAELADLLPESRLCQIARAAGLAWRKRLLTPATTTQLFLTQVLHGNTAVSHLRRLCGLDFTDSAYCQARARLSFGFFWHLQRLASGRLATAEGAERWRGHRTFHLDGSSFSMPDTPELQEEFGQPGAQAAGCGFPAAHLLVLFGARTGYLCKAVPAPLRTHDLRHTPALHTALQSGDVLVGDRAFGSFAHLALCRQRGLHAVCRLHQRRRRGHRRDRLVTYRKPRQPPAWLSAAAYAALPEALTVREVRVCVGTPGGRTRLLTLVTTLLNPKRYPARALAALFGTARVAMSDLRGGAEGTGDVRGGVQPGATGAVQRSAAAGSQAGPHQLRGRAALAAVRATRRAGATPARQPGAARAARAARQEAAAQAVRPDEPTPRRTTK